MSNVRIALNGERAEVPAALTVAGLLEHLGVDARRVAVEVDRRVIRRVDHARVIVEEGAEVEIVNFVGGGAGRQRLRHARRFGVLMALLIAVGGAVSAQTDTLGRLLALVKAGKAAEAWKAWEALPPGAEKQRLGVSVAAASGDISRGVTIYEQLTVTTKSPDPAALRQLTLAAARPLAESTDLDARVQACMSALMLDPAHGPCLKALQAMAADRDDARAQATGVFALANAGIDVAGMIDRVEPQLPTDQRLKFAQLLTRLPPARRLSLLRPLIETTDAALQYQTILILADIPGDDVKGALANVRPAPPARNAITIARAAHGDAASLLATADLLPMLFGYEKILAASALARAIDQRGVAALEELANSPTDLDRIRTAAALAKVSPDLAARILKDSLNGGSVAVRAAALLAAGVVRMGTEPAVYRRLADDTPATRAGAIAAIAETLVARPPQLPTP